MKKFLILAAFMAASSAPVLAQSSSGAAALSGSQSGAQAASQSGASSGSVLVLNQYSTQKDENGNVLGSPDTPYTSELRNVPAVSAPAIFGGGHPCLSGQSGGIAVAGFGGSYGASKPEPVCQLWYMGQPEAAIRLLVMTDPGACKALGNVGYYRVGKSVVPFACGETVKGGVDTPGFKSRTTKVRASTSSPKSGLTQCEKRDGKVFIGYTYNADKVAAKASCLRSLGYAG